MKTPSKFILAVFLAVGILFAYALQAQRTDDVDDAYDTPGQRKQRTQEENRLAKRQLDSYGLRAGNDGKVYSSSRVQGTNATQGVYGVGTPGTYNNLDYDRRGELKDAYAERGPLPGSNDDFYYSNRIRRFDNSWAYNSYFNDPFLYGPMTAWGSPYGAWMNPMFSYNPWVGSGWATRWSMGMGFGNGFGPGFGNGLGGPWGGGFYDPFWGPNYGQGFWGPGFGNGFGFDSPWGYNPGWGGMGWGGVPVIVTSGGNPGDSFHRPQPLSRDSQQPYQLGRASGAPSNAVIGRSNDNYQAPPMATPQNNLRDNNNFRGGSFDNGFGRNDNVGGRGFNNSGTNNNPGTNAGGTYQGGNSGGYGGGGGTQAGSSGTFIPR